MYYYKLNEKLYVSREVRFILNLLDDVKFDKMAIAQYLLFRCPLGKRTLFKNIHRLEPGSLIRISLTNSAIEIENLHRFNFMKKKYSRREIEENVNNMTALFIETCKNMATSMNEYTHILTLSGGLDSRIVAAGLKKGNIPFYGVTFLDHKKAAKIDTEVAEELADVLNINWKLLTLNSPKGKDYIKLLKIKSGFNYLAMSMILPFYYKILDVYGPRIINFTGDTGLALRDLSPLKNFRNLNEVIDYILYKNAQFELDEVSDLVGIKKNEIFDELKSQLQSYPENSMRQKYVHFIIYERGFYWHYEGIDRTRCFCWIASPLESTRFFDYVMNCPDNQKKNYKFYRKLLLKLSPETIAIDYANYKTPITSKKLKLKLFRESTYEKFPLSIRRFIRKNLIQKYLVTSTSYDPDLSIVKCIYDQLHNCESIHSYLSSTKIESLLKNCSKTQLNILFTITSLIEEYENEESSIQKYLESDFL